MGARAELVGASQGDGVTQEEGGDGCRWAIDGVGGVAGDVEEELDVDLGDRHVELGLQGVGGGGRPLGQGIAAHALILPPGHPGGHRPADPTPPSPPSLR